MKKVNKYYLLIFSMIMFTSCSISTTRTDKVHLKEPIESISKLQNYEINANVWYDGKLQESFNPEGSSFSAHLQSSVFKLSKDLIDSIHEEGIVAYTS